MNFLKSIAACVLILVSLRSYSQTTLYDTIQKPRLVSKQFAFTEGPAVDKKGNIFFTDQPNDKIWKYDTDGMLSVFMQTAGRPNGTYFDRKGNLIVCADLHNQLWQVHPKGKVKVLMTDYAGKLVNGPNDIWVDAHGGIYFTDPYYQRSWWARTKPDVDGQNVYYLAHGAKQPLVVDSTLKKPNGIVGTPDGKYLYVADIDAWKVYRFRINADRTLSDKQLFVSQGADGITLDEQGNLYLAGNGISVYNPKGEKIAHIPIPEPWTANVCFGGKNRDVLFMTASTAIYTLQMNVKGVE